MATNARTAEATFRVIESHHIHVCDSHSRKGSRPSRKCRLLRNRHRCQAKFDPYLLDNAKWYKIRNRNYSQWVGREISALYLPVDANFSCQLHPDVRFGFLSFTRAGKKNPVRSCSLKSILHHEESTMVGVGDPNLTTVVRCRRVRALGRVHRAKQARLPALRDSDDGERSHLRVGHIDMPEARVVSDQIRALSNLQSAKDPSVMGHVNHSDPSSAGADEKPRLGFVQREAARRTFSAVLPLRHDSVRGDIDRYGDLLVLAVRVDPRPDWVHRKRFRPSPASHF